jgi:hypothetical protein
MDSETIDNVEVRDAGELQLCIEGNGNPCIHTYILRQQVFTGMKCGAVLNQRL